MKPKPGDIVAVTFLDHSEHDGRDDDDAPLRFIVWGRVRRVTKQTYIIESWGDEDFGRVSGHDNIKTFTIIRRAVVGLQILTPEAGE